MEITGHIVFDPPDFTKKHRSQSSWKKTAQVIFDQDETDDMWRWWINKRYGLALNKNLRGSHLTFVNDKLDSWYGIDKKYAGRPVKIDLGYDLRSNGEHWWLKPTEIPEILTEIRVELGLNPDPYYPYHYTIGLVNDRNRNHSEYIRKIRQRK